MGSMIKDMRKFALARGWTYENTNGGHFRWSHPQTRKTVVTSQSPGDHRAILNFKAEIKRIEREAGINAIEVETRTRVSWQTGLQAIKDAREKPSLVISETRPEEDPYDVWVERKPGVPPLAPELILAASEGRACEATTPTGRIRRQRSEDFIHGIGTLKNGTVRQTISTMCCMCDATKEVFTHSKPGEPLQPNSQLAPAFRAQGWRVGVRRSEDMCPVCVKLEEDTRPDAPATPRPTPPAPAPAPAREPEYANGHANGDGGTVIAPPAAEAIAQPVVPAPETVSQITVSGSPEALSAVAATMPKARSFDSISITPPKQSMEERIASINVAAHRQVELAQEKIDEEDLQNKVLWRKIMRAIDRAYVDPHTGYATGESDAAIAKRFGVLTSDVAEFRAEHFGPELADSVTRDIARDLASLKRDLKNFQTNVIEAAAALETRIQKVLTKIDQAPDAAKYVVEHRKNSLNGATNGSGNSHAHGDVHAH